MEGSGHGPIYTKEKNQRNINHMSQNKFKTGFSIIQVSITSLANLLSHKMYANGNCLIICMQYQNMCTVSVWCQVSKRIMKEWCETHGSEWYTATMFNTFTLTLNQVWHHVITTNCHSIHHKHYKRLSKTIKLIKWCHKNQNGQFYIEPCNRWVQ